ncbi:MAG TPA: molybdopterin cofactor-binding domain-containing protein, partial [Ilumatobacteraceae bacterium]|nr:molybdopterin cofactor-binding domain-containing protein [Ilumatobacteraceae bacterium]
TRARATKNAPANVVLKDASAFTVVGTPHGRVDARDIVTGRKQFAMDLEVPGALPTMLCRPPTINGTVVSVQNIAAVKALPGVTDVAVIPSGVAVRAVTFGQCIDAVRALKVTWGGGPVDDKSDARVKSDLIAGEQPLAAPSSPVPGVTGVIDQTFTFAFASNSPLETNCAIADVRSDRAEIWSSLKTPILAQESIANELGLTPDKVVCHVAQGGGSFGRHLFFDAALEAVRVSKAMGKPVKLMWHRTDDFRQGRLHPMSTSHVRATYSGANVTSFEQRHTSVSTDWTHGFGEIVTATLAKPPNFNGGYSQTVFDLSQNVPYDFGAVSQTLNEVDPGFNTGAMRNVYSPNVTAARELIVDQLAKAVGLDAVEFRRSFLSDDRLLAVLNKAVERGRWGRSMPAGTAQGIGIHNEYKSRCAVLVEIDCTPATVNRTVANGYTGPRITKAVCAVDAGLPVNPRGLEAQMIGGMMDGIGLALTFSVHLDNGHLLEGSWDDTFYTRQWNVPFEVEVVVLPATTDVPGGAGELAVATTLAAVACAYARATGTLPTQFPINHDRASLGFEPLPTVPSIPPSPTDGLSRAF